MKTGNGVQGARSDIMSTESQWKRDKSALMMFIVLMVIPIAIAMYIGLVGKRVNTPRHTERVTVEIPDIVKLAASLSFHPIPTQPFTNNVIILKPDETWYSANITDDDLNRISQKHHVITIKAVILDEPIP